ncbi:MAG: molecular chaperone HtpG, partial [Desulfatitalea sp.]|nr:molecular chaperone HtpG [Desulfatitalea sp.]
VINIRNNLVNKILDLLGNMSAEDYEKFYEQFGAVIKEGIYSDTNKRTKLAALARYKTTRSEDKWISLDEYIKRMQADQKEIYYITGDDMNALINSPHLEKLKEKSYEVLLMVDPVDEWVMQVLTEYDGKSFKSAEKGDLTLDAAEEGDGDKEAFNALFSFIKGQLTEKVKEVKASSRLKESVACLSGDSYDMSAYMEKLLKAAGQKPPAVQRVLELNMAHPVTAKIKTLYENDRDNPVLKDYCQMLYDLAVIAEGGKLENPARFSRMVGEVLTEAIH